jgi:hypothetical protein
MAYQCKRFCSGWTSSSLAAAASRPKLATHSPEFKEIAKKE